MEFILGVITLTLFNKSVITMIRHLAGHIDKDEASTRTLLKVMAKLSVLSAVAISLSWFIYVFVVNFSYSKSLKILNSGHKK